MSEPIRILIQCDPHRTSPNQRLHWRERHRRNQIARCAAFAGWLKSGKPKSPGPVRVSVIVARARRLDIDNVWAGLKPAMDDLFNGRVTPNDNPDWVQLGTVTQEISTKWKGREEVEFVITEEPCTTTETTT